MQAMSCVRKFNVFLISSVDKKILLENIILQLCSIVLSDQILLQGHCRWKTSLQQKTTWQSGEIQQCTSSRNLFQIFHRGKKKHQGVVKNLLSYMTTQLFVAIAISGFNVKPPIIQRYIMLRKRQRPNFR